MDRYRYTDSGNRLLSISMVCPPLSSCSPPFFSSLLCTWPVEGIWQVRYTIEFGHSAVCPNGNSGTSKRRGDKIRAETCAQAALFAVLRQLAPLPSASPCMALGCPR